MFELRELYQEVIVDHNRNPRNFYKLSNATCHADGFNPLCGDRLTLYLLLENDIIAKASFEGAGCAISTASASLMTEQLLGKTLAEAELLFKNFHLAITQETIENHRLENLPDKLKVLLGVRDYPARVKCATLAWHTLHAALTHQQKPVSTE